MKHVGMWGVSAWIDSRIMTKIAPFAAGATQKALYFDIMLYCYVVVWITGGIVQEKIYSYVNNLLGIL